MSMLFCVSLVALNKKVLLSLHFLHQHQFVSQLITGTLEVSRYELIPKNHFC